MKTTPLAATRKKQRYPKRPTDGVRRDPLQDSDEFMDDPLAFGDDAFAGARMLLFTARLKITAPRLAVLALLEEVRQPLSIDEAFAKLKEGSWEPDASTVYRTLETLAEAGLADRVALGDGRSHYEIAMGRAHHHHATCSVCGDIEDIAGCDSAALNAAANRSLKKFSSITSHSLEYSGVCKDCAAK